MQAFINNVMGMVQFNTKSEMKDMVRSILFHDPNAKYEDNTQGRLKRIREGKREAEANRLFSKLMRMHVLREHGVYHMIVADWSLDAKAWQTLLIKDEENSPELCLNPNCRRCINSSKAPGSPDDLESSREAP